MSLGEFTNEYNDVGNRVRAAEKPNPPADDPVWNLYKQGDMEGFQQARGYTPEEIADYKRWQELNGAGKDFDYTDKSPESLWRQHHGIEAPVQPTEEAIPGPEVESISAKTGVPAEELNRVLTDEYTDPETGDTVTEREKSSSKPIISKMTQEAT